ncbi:unnamed protein product [Aphanomyces euteiches]|uniref:Uncharacterized protein n=1 Tax=Aphanomyces euteiches TaxID=100861 RepID=A0A6G0WVH7_9STRA|nr:hypothetical protein Ae201684_011167 [Aphanomyces euteiches]KAH9058745.1 hypothetical protein Ae201684P_006086 [Aphanomyces euteiches]KAH9114230.1 hypothetical protein AeMF1_011664 [Aphanomyces euteiches]KAH9132228.1 hypothetical protein LEN26_007479 [Aphanomyces euteiches]KAH9156990.1 hypothetical protein AeRB84_001149 [Aphanomyces euteiches]
MAKGKPPRLEPLASVTYAQHPSQGAEELDVLKAIVAREMCLDQFLQLVTSFTASPGDILEALLVLRTTSLAVVEAVASWRSHMVRPLAFQWQGVNYIHRMASDADFLSKSSEIHRTLEFKLKRRNPFCTVPGLDSPFFRPRDADEALTFDPNGTFVERLHNAAMYILEEETRLGGPFKPASTDPRWAYIVQREAERSSQLRFGKA